MVCSKCKKEIQDCECIPIRGRNKVNSAQKSALIREMGEVLKIVAGCDPLQFFDSYCDYCEGEEHTPDCLYVKAKNILKKAKKARLIK